MDSKFLSQYTKLPAATVDRLSRMTPQQIFADAEYMRALQSLDVKFLEQTLPMARDAYEGNLQEFSRRLTMKYRINVKPMSPFTLGNWVVGVLQFPAEANRLLEMHGRIGGNMIADGLPELIEMLASMPKGSSEWQQALSLLSLPLMNKN